MKQKLKIPKRKQMHLALDIEIHDKLSQFAESRDRTFTYVIEQALKLLFDNESVDSTKERALSLVVSRKFSIPKGFTIRAFWLSLWMLSDRYPDLSVKSYWGEMVYLSSKDISHKNLFLELKDDIELELSKHAKEEKK